MYIIRNVFTAKPGNASKLAAQLKEGLAPFNLANARILTDLTGDFNRVIMEYSVESLAEYETRMQEIMGSAEYRERLGTTLELWMTGSREILRVV